MKKTGWLALMVMVQLPLDTKLMSLGLGTFESFRFYQQGNI